MAGGTVRRVEPWWFPGSYLLHASEEYWCGETFPVWISRWARVQFDAVAFLWLNGIAMVAMVGAVVALRRRRLPWLLPALGTIVVTNGMAHTVGSLLTRTYSPGLVTGLAMWVPLGALALHQARRELPRRMLAFGVATGLLAHGLVSGTVLVMR